MALIDYITSQEFDACFYTFIVDKRPTFEIAVDETVKNLLHSDYKFEGIDRSGNRVRKVRCDQKTKKLVNIWFKGKGEVDPRTMLNNGREFLKKVNPSLVKETDEEFANIMKTLPVG